jgi:tetratricopeptide (TPR) repeat protein
MRILRFLFIGAAAAFAVLAQDVDQAVGLFNSRKYDDAERSLRQAVEAAPDNVRARQYLGMTLLEKGKLNEAEEAFKKAQELSPDSDQARIGLARVAIQRKQYDEASAQLDAAEKLNADSPELFYARGLMNVSRGNHKDAVKDLETAIEKQPKNAYAHYYAGIAYNGIKRPDKMVEHFEAFLKLAPDAPEAAKVRSLLKGVR